LEGYKLLVKKLQEQVMQYNEPQEELKNDSKLFKPMTDIKEEYEEMKHSGKGELVEISYVPSRNNTELTERDEVAIVSEFTAWKQERMARELRNGEYIYTAKFYLQPGFKYKFRFIVNETQVNDLGYAITKNTLGQSYNYIIIPSELGTPLVKHKSYINPSIESQARQEALKKYFGPIKFKKEDGEPVKDNLNDCIGRLLYKYKEPEGLFKLVKWDEEDKEATLKRLTDNHNIPLDPNFHTKQSYLFLNELKSQFFFIKAAEEEAVISALSGNRLKINYKIRKDPNAVPGQVAIDYDTVSVEPDNIPIQDVRLDRESSMQLSMIWR
jgi:hypothetical protein